MTPDQLAARNAITGAGVKRSWADPVVRARRIEALIAAWDDPLLRAMARKRAEGRPPPPAPLELSDEERRARKRARRRREESTPHGKALKLARQQRWRRKCRSKSGPTGS